MIVIGALFSLLLIMKAAAFLWQREVPALPAPNPGPVAPVQTAPVIPQGALPHSFGADALLAWISAYWAVALVGLAALALLYLAIRFVVAPLIGAAAKSGSGLLWAAIAIPVVVFFWYWILNPEAAQQRWHRMMGPTVTDAMSNAPNLHVPEIPGGAVSAAIPSPINGVAPAGSWTEWHQVPVEELRYAIHGNVRYQCAYGAALPSNDDSAGTDSQYCSHFQWVRFTATTGRAEIFDMVFSSM
jgi:hypothetical protein